MSKVLVIDDDPFIVELIKINLELSGHDVITAPDGIKGMALAKQEIPNLIIVDVMMPEVDGFTVTQRLRQNETTKNVGILMLTALGEIKDKSQGFTSGADDYLVKPFDIEELKLRVLALLRRTKNLPESLLTPEILMIGDVTLLPETLSADITGTKIKLTPIEYAILNALVQKHGQAVPAGVLLKDIWGYSQEDDIETIRVHIRHLRSKMEKACAEKKYIETIYGGGYKLIPAGILKKQ